jgi:hypothetical protein
LPPGEAWEQAIVAAILNGIYFVPCFSRNYAARQETFMNDELRVACRRSQFPDRAWLEHYKKTIRQRSTQSFQSSIPIPSEFDSSTVLAGAHERVVEARARREAVATTYQAQVAAFLKRLVRNTIRTGQ